MAKREQPGDGKDWRRVHQTSLAAHETHRHPGECEAAQVGGRAPLAFDFGDIWRHRCRVLEKKAEARYRSWGRQHLGFPGYSSSVVTDAIGTPRARALLAR